MEEQSVVCTLESTADTQRNNKRGGVGIYFKETLAIWPVPTNSLKECLLWEGFIANKK